MVTRNVNVMYSPYRSLYAVLRSGSIRPQQAKQPDTASNLSILFQGAKHSLLITTLTWATGSSLLLAADVKRTQDSLMMVNRSIAQDQGAWVVDYRLRYTGRTGVVITAEDVRSKRMAGSPTRVCQVMRYHDGRRYGYHVDLIFPLSLKWL